MLASGAVNARAPSQSAPQVEFKLDHNGGPLRNTCKPVELPLAWLVAACQAGDGSYWALQSWQRLLPNSGGRPTPAQAARELRLSHWTGQLATLEPRFGRSYGRFVQLYGVNSHGGQPVFGYKVPSGGRSTGTDGTSTSTRSTPTSGRVGSG